jgi:dTMP kinase
VGLFVSFEGGDGCGKTAQIERLRSRIEEKGHQVIAVHEPGTTPLGEFLRTWLKSHRPTSFEAELFLFAAARSELVSSIIMPHLDASNSVIVADRYADSTTAYQGFGRSLDLEQVKSANQLATRGIWPDLTVLLDLDPSVGLARRKGLDAPDQRKFEEESLSFHSRVREGYLFLAKQEPDRWFVVDAALPQEKVSDLVWSRVVGLL